MEVSDPTVPPDQSVPTNEWLGLALVPLSPASRAFRSCGLHCGRMGLEQEWQQVLQAEKAALLPELQLVVRVLPAARLLQLELVVQLVLLPALLPPLPTTVLLNNSHRA